MSDIIIDSLVEKVNRQDTRIEADHKVVSDLAQSVAGLTDQSNVMREVTATTKIIQHQVSKWKFPTDEISDLTRKLAINNELRLNPKNEKVIRIHKLDNLLWVLVGLFFLIIFLVIGWRDTFRELERYEMHDITWRYLKLENNVSLDYLQKLESHYSADPLKMKETVENKELHQRQLLEAERAKKQAEEKLQQLKDQVSNDSSFLKKNEKKTSTKSEK